jgi:hypothetical protein
MKILIIKETPNFKKNISQFEAELIILLNEDNTFRVIKNRLGSPNLKGKIGELLDTNTINTQDE